jgi:hypothetical protein
VILGIRHVKHVGNAQYCIGIQWGSTANALCPIFPEKNALFWPAGETWLFSDLFIFFWLFSEKTQTQKH